MATASVLTKRQRKTFGPVPVKAYGYSKAAFTAEVRYDDECGNGHNTFAITGEVRTGGGVVACGCLHDEVAKAFPELAPLIKWHLVSSDGPTHYVANTVYHALEHGPKYAWVYFTGPSDPKNLEGVKERLVGYVKADKASECEGVEGYRVQWDEKSAKVRNLDHARSSAVWPDATDEDLTAPGLKERLEARLPKLLEEFRAAVESLGFTY